jgi:hypothetical protein
MWQIAVALLLTQTVTIDGKVTPDRIPEYVVWRHTFHLLKMASVDRLPDALAMLTTWEKDFVLRESAKIEQHLLDCNTRKLQAREPLQKLEAEGKNPFAIMTHAQIKVVDEAMWAIELQCRWDILTTRDRVLVRLTPEAQTALRSFVDQRKEGISFTVPENGLARFRQPQ